MTNQIHSLAVSIPVSSQIQLSPPMEMSSREIAGLTGKELYHVHRDIRAMLDELGDPNPDHPNLNDDSNLNHAREDKDERGYTTCFYLNKELTYTLLTGYSTVLRNRIVKRWIELERLNAPVNPVEYIDPTRVIYLGQEHDPSLAGMYYAALEAKVYGSAKTAKKFKYMPGFIDAILKLSNSDLAKMGQRAQNSATEMMADAMKLRAKGAPLQLEKW